MRLVAFEDDGAPALGLREGGEVINLTEHGLPASLEEFIRGAQSACVAVERLRRRSLPRRPLADLTLLPPLRAPAKAIAVGLNYRDHACESQFEVPSYPVLFQRFPSSWVAHGAPLIRPRLSSQFDYEGELVVIIGQAGRHISRDRALDHVAGYSIFNDGSVRDYQFKSAQWMMGKNFDQSGSFGPEFVSADELPAGAAGLQLQTRVNGAVLQDANTHDMIFDVATLIAACSEAMTLQPGDMIISGTPSGVGFAQNPPVFLTPGDLCEVEVEGIGILSNPVTDESTIDLTIHKSHEMQRRHPWQSPP